jgi:NAD(P)H-quinone oxidoreductase subunit 5
MSTLLPWILPAIPGLPLAAGLAARALRPRTAGRLARMVASLSLALAAVAAVACAISGPATVRWAPFGESVALAAAFRIDAVSVTMLLLASFLGWVVLGFSQRYLAGDPAQARFFSWLSLTLGSVLTLVLAGHLLVLAASWIATSLCLHRLLLHYPERAGAIFSARKKFVFSRLGDACMLAAAILLHHRFGTYDITVILTTVEAGPVAGLEPVAWLLAWCAMLKSAQFPFHSWLPDTMETPTPVSAFMHAGIVNAGGYLVVRFAPLFAHAPGASSLLALTGALTAAFGAVVMLTQPSVKRSLAYSTIAQMGFMMLQCGLGAYALAMLHIAAHSLYKAHAFLSAGSSIGTEPRAAVPLSTPALAGGLVAGGFLVVASLWLIRVFAPAAPLHPGIFAIVLAFALAYGIARAWSAGGGLPRIIRGAGVAAVISLLSLSLHGLVGAVFARLPVHHPAPAVWLAVCMVFAGLFLFQALLWRANAHDTGRRLYVHALNGFYVGTYFNRILGQLWPASFPRS